MNGIAQKAFLESHPHAIKKRYASAKSKPHWPLLETLIEKGYFSYSDYYLAETLLQNVKESSEEIALFICYLSLSTRLGHMCIIVDDTTLKPLPQQLRVMEEEEEVDFYQLKQMIQSGEKTLPLSLVFTPDEVPTKPFCRDKNSYYLQKYWHYEQLFLNKLHTIIETSSSLTPDETYVNREVEKMSEANTLLPEQGQAILQGCTSPFTVITGGPGTGKTYTAGHLIRIYFEALPANEQSQCMITLAAPTGKAAANLQKSLLQSIGDTLKSQALQAKTIHSLLLDKRNRSLSPQGFLHTNFLLIDECSMIDARMMTKLFSAIRPGTKVILLGDKFQLPPVEVGSLFADITDVCNNSVIQLKKCLRADMQELVDFARAINEGNTDAVVKTIDNGSCIHRLEHQTDLSPSKQQKTLLQEIIPHYKSVTEQSKDLLDLLKAYQKYRVLTPLRHGPFGVNTLNEQIYKEMNKSNGHVPIMIAKNDYNINLFNGETGLLIKKNKDHPELQQGDFAAFIVFDQESQTETLRTVPALLLPSYEYAYCMSIHKSQGSEFDHVCMLIPEGSEVFGREVLYTAATRAKKQLTVWTSNSTVEKTLQKTAERISGISALDKKR